MSENATTIITIAIIVAAVALTVVSFGTGGILAGIVMAAVLGGISDAAINIAMQGYANGYGNITGDRSEKTLCLARP